MTFCVPFF